MIEEQAQVIEINGNNIILQAQTQSSCGSCSASKGCGTSLLAKVIGRKFTQFQAENDIQAQVGDTVVVGIAEDALLKGSLMMYLLPIVSMLMFSLLADYLIQSFQYKDLTVAASALFGLGVGAILAKLYFQLRSSRLSFAPVVLRKIIGHGKLS